MTLLCAPVKQFKQSEKVDLIETIDKTLYQQGRPRYVDVDWKTPVLPPGDVIVSYHNYEETPDLEAVLKILQQAHPKAHFYKIATMATSTLDSLRMLDFLQKHPKIIGLCMGELGAITRISAPIFHVPIMYAPLCEEDINAPGQIIVDQLQEIYHFSQLNPETKIFGLIGDPVHRSPGHLYHNDVFRKKTRNGVYVKMVVRPSELSDFIDFSKKLPFGGLSVTAPLKEAVIPFLDEIDPVSREQGAINTLVFKKGKIFGYNTDGDAALDVLSDVIHKTIVILGAGGAAKAIAYSAVQRKAEVVIVNRTADKARSLAESLGCGWSQTIPKYDILINATSVSMPIDEDDLVQGKTVMEIALYETEFLKAARRKGCQAIDGMPMYLKQAAAQQELWFDTFQSNRRCC
jgi:3-dehydroquinate dehydratase/shikimate dehydrogenase